MKKILIIEDSTSMMEQIKKIIENNFKCEIFEAYDGLEGIKKAREYNPDVILMDIVLPYISGYAATVRLRKIEGLKNTVIIGMTANVDKNTKDKVLTWCDNFIPKPIDEKVIVPLLRNYLSPNKKMKRIKISIKKTEKFKEEVTSEIVEQLEQRVVELEEAKQRIEYLNKLKTRLMTLFSHEIKTPLTTITGYSECLKLTLSETLSTDDENMLDRIGNASKRINSLLEEINLFNRLEFDKARNENCNPYEIIKYKVEKRRKFIEEKNLTVIYDCDKNIEINLNKNYMKDIFDQLLKNAIVYNELNGEIYIESKLIEKNFVLKISDTGCGIEDSMLNSIFDPLTQDVDVEHYKTHQLRGLGMGLAICKQMVESVNGQISLNSRKDGPGTVVTVTIPESK